MQRRVSLTSVLCSLFFFLLLSLFLLAGPGAKATLLWGRWQFRNRTEGSVQGATLMSEPPTITDDTMEVWGRWALAQVTAAACL
eukprot:3266999-Rhodomonas_salina.2